MARLIALALVLILASPRASTAPDSSTFVDAHNAVRAKVQKPAGYTGAWVPIPPVAWSDELAGGAQDWADHLRDSNKCQLVHSDARYGENLAGGKDLDIGRAVKMWAEEGDRYRYSPQYEFEIPTGHYTQVVWRKTTHMGCGRATCGRKVVIVCRYNPPGNHIGKAPY